MFSRFVCVFAFVAFLDLEHNSYSGRMVIYEHGLQVGDGDAEVEAAATANCSSFRLEMTNLFRLNCLIKILSGTCSFDPFLFAFDNTTETGKWQFQLEVG